MRESHLAHLRRGHLADQHEEAAYEQWLREHTTAAELRVEPQAETVTLANRNRQLAAELGVEL